MILSRESHSRHPACQILHHNSKTVAKLLLQVTTACMRSCIKGHGVGKAENTALLGVTSPLANFQAR